MTDTHPPAESADTPRGGNTTEDRASFGRLAEELSELDFACTTDDTATVTYAAIDSTTEIKLDLAQEPRRAILANAGVDAAGDWEITFTEATPDETQLVILYTVLHPDHPAEGWNAAASALGIAVNP
jgi:hypothetical protein